CEFAERREEVEIEFATKPDHDRLNDPARAAELIGAGQPSGHFPGRKQADHERHLPNQDAVAPEARPIRRASAQGFGHGSPSAYERRPVALMTSSAMLGSNTSDSVALTGVPLLMCMNLMSFSSWSGTTMGLVGTPLRYLSNAAL